MKYKVGDVVQPIADGTSNTAWIGFGADERLVVTRVDDGDNTYELALEESGEGAGWFSEDDLRPADELLLEKGDLVDVTDEAQGIDGTYTVETSKKDGLTIARLKVQITGDLIDPRRVAALEKAREIVGATAFLAADPSALIQVADWLLAEYPPLNAANDTALVVGGAA